MQCCLDQIVQDTMIPLASRYALSLHLLQALVHCLVLVSIILPVLSIASLRLLLLPLLLLLLLLPLLLLLELYHAVYTAMSLHCLYVEHYLTAAIM
jgi:hypothetical protein